MHDSTFTQAVRLVFVLHQVIQSVTFSSSSWRSLITISKGHLTIPKRSQRIARQRPRLQPEDPRYSSLLGGAFRSRGKRKPWRTSSCPAGHEAQVLGRCRVLMDMGDGTLKICLWSSRKLGKLSKLTHTVDGRNPAPVDR